jgi:carboxymethylenebutenolidase
MAAIDAPEADQLAKDGGFRAAVAFYPACGLKGRFPDGLVPYAPVRIFHGTADEEVSPRRCEALVNASRARGADIDVVLYPGAEHGFDEPSRKRQRKAANAAAKADATAKALAFVADVTRK